MAEEERKPNRKMNYEKINDRIENKRRVITFKNTKTGTETKITPIYTDAGGVEWFGFVDLFKIPYIRLAYSKHIADLFTVGLSLKDIQGWCDQEKALLKSDDPEKYEKLYALILDKQRIAEHTADPIKKQLALCTVYVLTEDEDVGYFDESICEEKLRLWKADRQATGFFLNWHGKHILNYIDTFWKTSKIVSNLQDQGKI